MDLFKKTKIIILSIITVCMFTKCKNREYSYDQLKNMRSTHKIQSLDLQDKIEKTLKDKENFGEFEDEIIILFIKKKIKTYEICISITEFNTFKNYRPDLYNDLKGYLNFQNVPVLLFGNMDEVFYVKNKVDFHNVLGKLPEYNLDNPPIVYEPKMICNDLVIVKK